MARWGDVVVAAGELAGAVQARLSVHGFGLLATVRSDGSPRISGCELQYSGEDLYLGMMGGSRKAMDLQRDPRFALHNASVDPNVAEGDAKIGGRAVEVIDPDEIALWRAALPDDVPPGPFHLFRLDVTEMSLLMPAGDHLVISNWREGRGEWQVDRF